jgi:dTDP-4-dehydrorhamnose 3,5-epimerase
LSRPRKCAFALLWLHACHTRLTDRGAHRARLRYCYYRSGKGLVAGDRGIAAMHFTETRVAGAWIIDISPHHDERGRFMRAWCVREFEGQGIHFLPVQANMQFNPRRAPVCGLHLQIAPALRQDWCVAHGARSSRGRSTSGQLGRRPQGGLRLPRRSGEMAGATETGAECGRTRASILESKPQKRPYRRAPSRAKVSRKIQLGTEI